MVVLFPAWSLFFFFGVPFFFSPLIFAWRRVVSQPSISRTWYTRYYTAVRLRRIMHLACIFTYTHIFFWRRMVSQPSTSVKGLVHPVLYCCATYYLYTWHVFIHILRSRVLLPLLLLLCAGVVAAAAAAVRHRVPDGKNWLVHWIWFHPLFFFFSFKHDLF